MGCQRRWRLRFCHYVVLLAYRLASGVLHSTDLILHSMRASKLVFRSHVRQSRNGDDFPLQFEHIQQGKAC